MLPGSRTVPVPSGLIALRMQSSQSFVSCTNKIRPFLAGPCADAARCASPLAATTIVRPITNHRRMAPLPPRPSLGRIEVPTAASVDVPFRNGESHTKDGPFAIGRRIACFGRVRAGVRN
jgi:hypothetical protein